MSDTAEPITREERALIHSNGNRTFPKRFWPHNEYLSPNLLAEAYESALSASEAREKKLEEEIAVLKSTVISFLAPWATNYAKNFGFDDGELHPTHYDILEYCGARMTDFRRARQALGE